MLTIKMMIVFFCESPANKRVVVHSDDSYSVVCFRRYNFR